MIVKNIDFNPPKKQVEELISNLEKLTANLEAFVAQTATAIGDYAKSEINTVNRRDNS